MPPLPLPGELVLLSLVLLVVVVVVVLLAACHGRRGHQHDCRGGHGEEQRGLGPHLFNRVEKRNRHFRSAFTLSTPR